MLELLTILATRLRDDIGAEPERRGLSILETVGGVGDHGTPNGLAILGGGILVEDREHSDRHVGSRIIAEILRDRNDANHLAAQPFLGLKGCVQNAEGKLCLFVAIDRTCKFAVTQFVEKADRRTACELLEHLLKAGPTASTRS